MGVLKQGLRCDFDRLQDQADGHIKIRQMLDHGNLDESEYEIQNIRDNVELMTPELLREAGRLIARADAKLSRKKSGATLVGRCGSFVAETDVHHPTPPRPDHQKLHRRLQQDRRRVRLGRDRRFDPPEDRKIIHAHLRNRTLAETL